MSTREEFHAMKFYPWGIPRHKMPPPEKFHAMKCLSLRNSMPWCLPLRNFMPWNVYPWGIPCHEMSTPEEFHAIKCLPLRNSTPWNVYPWGIPCHECLPLRNSMPWNVYPWGIPCSFDPTPEEFEAQFTLTIRNSMLIWPYPWGNLCSFYSTLRSSKVLDRGVRLLNGIAHCNFVVRAWFQILKFMLVVATLSSYVDGCIRIV